MLPFLLSIQPEQALEAVIRLDLDKIDKAVS